MSRPPAEQFGRFNELTCCPSKCYVSNKVLCCLQTFDRAWKRFLLCFTPIHVVEPQNMVIYIGICRQLTPHIVGALITVRRETTSIVPSACRTCKLGHEVVTLQIWSRGGHVANLVTSADLVTRWSGNPHIVSSLTTERREVKSIVPSACHTILCHSKFV